MHGATIASLQRGRHAPLRGQRLAQRLPTVVDALGLELQAQRVHEVVSQHADEQMPFDAAIDLVEHRAQAQIGLQGPEHRLQVGLRQEKLGYFYDVITNGFGAMQGYAEQVPVRDRWLIVAYVRTLQLSQHASVNDVPADRRGALDAAATASGAASAGQGGTTAKPAEKH